MEKKLGVGERTEILETNLEGRPKADGLVDGAGAGPEGGPRKEIWGGKGATKPTGTEKSDMVRSEMTAIEGRTTDRNLNDLPDDTLVLILSYLSPHDLFKMETVCKKWLEILSLIWRSYRKVSIAELLNIRPAFDCEIRWHTPFPKPLITEEALRCVAKRCGKFLRHLESGCPLKLGLQCLSVLASEFPRLQTLDLSKTTVVFPEESEEVAEFDMGSVFGELRQIRMDACFDDSAVAYYSLEQVDPLLFKFFSAMPRLESASLVQNTLFSGSALLGMSTSVRNLDLGFCRRATADTLMLVFSSLPNLTHVSLYSNNRLTGACLPYLPADLESIDLSYCDSLDVDSLINFFRTHRRLRHVQLAHVGGLTDSVLATMAECLPNLEGLNLSCYLRGSYYEQLQHVHDITLGVKALNAAKSLKILDLSKNDFVFDATLIGISYGCVRLEDVSVSQLANCTALGFASLGRLENLKKLDISENDCVDESVLLSMAHGGNLEFVNARKCSMIKESTVKNLGQFWPNKTTVFQVF